MNNNVDLLLRLNMVLTPTHRIVRIQIGKYQPVLQHTHIFTAGDVLPAEFWFEYLFLSMHGFLSQNKTHNIKLLITDAPVLLISF